jgi:hypothetical protein
MRYRIKSGAGFSGLMVATDDPQDALVRARQLEEQGLDISVIDEDDVALTIAEFEQRTLQPPFGHS